MLFWGLALLWSPSLPYYIEIFFLLSLLSLLLLVSHIFFTWSRVLTVFMICTFPPIYKLALIQVSQNHILIKKDITKSFFSIRSVLKWVNEILACLSAAPRLAYSCIWVVIFCLFVLFRIYSKLGSHLKVVCSSQCLSYTIFTQALHLATFWDLQLTCYYCFWRPFRLWLLPIGEILISVYVLAHNLGSVSNLSLAKPSVPSGMCLAPVWWDSLPYEIHEIQPADAFTASLTNLVNLAALRFAFFSVSRTASCSCCYAIGAGGLWNTYTYETL